MDKGDTSNHFGFVWNDSCTKSPIARRASPLCDKPETGLETPHAIELVGIPKYDDCSNRGAPMSGTPRHYG
jgi:hypothetical protein